MPYGTGVAKALPLTGPALALDWRYGLIASALIIVGERATRLNRRRKTI